MTAITVASDHLPSDINRKFGNRNKNDEMNEQITHSEVLRQSQHLLI